MVASAIAEAWTKYAKEYGWPHRKTTSDVYKDRKAIRTCSREFAQGKQKQEILKGISWILGRWNWSKTPAPLNLLTSKSQWAGYKMVLARLEEEAQAAIQLRSQSLLDWVSMEIKNRVQKGMDPTEARKETEEFALILGKTKGMNKEEKLLFCSYCEEIENLYKR
jgi:hypothetical protein